MAISLQQAVLKHSGWRAPWLQQMKKGLEIQQQVTKRAAADQHLRLWRIYSGVYVSSFQRFGAFFLTYNQQSIYRRKVRLCITHLILQKNQLQEGATGLPPMRSARTPRRRPSNPTGAPEKVPKGQLFCYL